MDKLTDRPAGKRTNKPTDERMTVERERERGGGGGGEGKRERGRERGRETESQKNWNCIKRIAPVVFP